MNLRELTHKAGNGCRNAQQRLFELYTEQMLTLCGRYVKIREDAEEVMMNGFNCFFLKLSMFSYKDDVALLTWLKRIMIIECLQHLDKRKVIIMVTQKEAEEIPIGQQAITNLSTAEILNIVKNLPDGFKTIFNLYEIEGYSHKEISKLLNISESNSCSQLSRAKTLLRKLIPLNEKKYEKYT